MTKNPIDIREISSLLDEGRILASLDILDNAAEAFRPLAHYKAELNRLREQYGYMSDFALRGLPDPGLPDNVAIIAEGIRSAADSMSRTLTALDAPTLYYSKVRTADAGTGRPVADILADYRRISGRLSLASLAENPGKATRDLTTGAEAYEKELFDTLWISYPLTAGDAEALSGMIADDALPSYAKSLAVSGLTLGLMEWYDARRLRLLMDACEAADDAVAVRALCGLLIGLWMYRGRPMSRSLRERFDALRERDGWATDVRTATMQFIRARDTERLTRKFNDELLPEMMKLRPEIERLQHRHSDPDSNLIEENPEWAELLEKSGLSDRLKEMQEIQEEGGDVMMATFSRLKTFPFFHEAANWFLPFHTSHSIFATPEAETFSRMLGMMGDAVAFCDSDKYSIALSLGQIPASQREMMADQIRMQGDQLDMAAAASPRQLSRERLTVDYVRNLYRFFKLFRRKAEFKDPFAAGLNIPALPELRDVFDDPETLRLIGEFYFRRRYFADAFSIFERLDLLAAPEAELYQKMGYCRQALGDTGEAIRYYEQSEMLNPRSRWTRRRLASCHRQQGNYEGALRLYRSLSEDDPDDVALTLNIGLCLLKLRRFDEALQELFKAEYLGTDSPKALRAIVWCTLLGGDYERCRVYTDRVLALPDPTPTDLLNGGHLAMLTGSPAEGARLYAASIAARDFDTEAFMADMARDRAAVKGLAALPPCLLSIAADRATVLARDMGARI